MNESFYGAIIDYEENVACWYPTCIENASQYGYCVQHLELRGQHLRSEEKTGIRILAQLTVHSSVAELERRVRVFLLLASLIASRRLTPRYSI